MPKMHQKSFGVVLCPNPLGELKRSPNPLAEIEEVLLPRRGRERKGRGGKKREGKLGGRGRKRRGEKRRGRERMREKEGKGCAP